VTLDDDCALRRTDDVVSRVLDGEAVLLDLREGIYFGLNEVGTRIWELLGEGATVAELRAKIFEEFDVEEAVASADLVELLDELLDRGLIERVGLDARS
jgi:hypothetical protein